MVNGSTCPSLQLPLRKLHQTAPAQLFPPSIKTQLYIGILIQSLSNYIDPNPFCRPPNYVQMKQKAMISFSVDLLLDGGPPALAVRFILAEGFALVGTFLLEGVFVGNIAVLLVAGEADAEEEEDFFDFGELIAEVSVDDQEGEDVDAVDQDDESIQQGHRHEGLLQGTDALPLYHRCQVGVDSRELHREDASVPEVFSQVVGDVVVLAVVVQRQPHLEGVYYREVGHCPGAVAKGVVVALVEHRAGVLKVNGGDESVQLRRKEQVVHVMLQLAQTVSDGVQLWLVQHSFVLDFVDKLAAAGVDRSHVFSLAEDRLEVADLARKDRGEDKQANDVDYEANNSDSSNRVDDLSTQHRFLGILPLLEFASTRQKILGVHIEVLPGHFDRILHLFSVLLEQLGLSIRDKHQVSQLILRFVVALHAVQDHQEVNEENQGYRGIKKHIFEQGKLTYVAADASYDILLREDNHIVELNDAGLVHILDYAQVFRVHYLSHVSQHYVDQLRQGTRHRQILEEDRVLLVVEQTIVLQGLDSSVGLLYLVINIHLREFESQP